MADPQNFEGANIHAGPPRGLEEMVGWLHVFFNGRGYVSAWKPTAAELADLNAGGSIFVHFLSGSREDGAPLIFPMFVGNEENVKEVVSDSGGVW